VGKELSQLHKLG